MQAAIQNGQGLTPLFETRKSTLGNFCVRPLCLTEWARRQQNEPLYIQGFTDSKTTDVRRRLSGILKVNFPSVTTTREDSPETLFLR
jgi:hypothetical protein